MCFNSFDGCFPGRGELSRESHIGEVKKELDGQTVCGGYTTESLLKWADKIGCGEILKNTAEQCGLFTQGANGQVSKNLNYFWDDLGVLKPSKLELINLTRFLSF